MTTKISIITSCYNSGKTVKDTLESILSQTYQNYELIIKDGGSKDDTLNICREYESRFEGRMRIISEPDKGIYDAMNVGIKYATGDVIGVLNSDDFYYDNNVLSDIANSFDNESVECVFGDLLFVDAQDTSKVKREWKGAPYKEGCFKKGWVPAHPTFYARRSLFEKYGDFKIQYKVSADFDLMYRFLGVNKATSTYIPRYFVKMRMGGESTGSLSNIIKGNMDIVHVLRENGCNVSYFYIVRRLAPKFWDMLLRKFGMRK